MPTFGGQVGAPSMRANARGAERQKAAPTAQIGARLDAPNGAAHPPHGHGSGSEYSEPSTRSPDSQSSAPSARPKKQNHSGKKSSPRYPTRPQKIP